MDGMRVRCSDDEADATNSSDFNSLIMRARQAHDVDIRRLESEVQSLRQRLAAARGDMQDSCANTLAKRADSPVDPDMILMITEESLPNPRASPHVLSDVAHEGSVDILRQPGEGEKLDNQGSLAPAPSPKQPDNLRGSIDTSSRLSQVTKTSDFGLMARSMSRVRTWNATQESSVLKRLVSHPGFEVFICAIIILNGVVLAAEAQYQGFDLAVWTGHDSAGGVSSDVWPHGEDFFRVCEWTFGVIYLLEVVVKLAAERREFFRDCWNLFDLSLVAFWLYSLYDVDVGMNAQLLRIVRLSRLLRLVRLFHYATSSGFDPLYIMVTSLGGGVVVLAWSFLLLLTLHVALALLFNQALHLWYFNESQAENQIEVFKYFGSFFRSLLTMFEFTLANWVTPAWVLTENVHEGFILYAILHKMILGFAIIGVVNGVFIQETFKVATLDDAIMVRQTARKEAAHIAKMKRLFQRADQDNSSTIDREEWLSLCKHKWVQNWLKAQDFDVRDPSKLFGELDDGSGRLTAKALVEGTTRLKGAASPMAMVRLINEVRSSVERIERQFELYEARSLDTSFPISGPVVIR